MLDNPFLDPEHWLNISGVNLDITHRCLLQCPKCLRQQFPGLHMRGHDIELKNLEKIIDSPFEQFNFCGQMGDCVYHSKFLDILKLCDNYKKKFIFHTNGHGKREKWWNEVSDIIQNKNKFTFVFALDGLPKDSHIYRKNQDGVKVWEVMKKLAKINSNIKWQYIIFKYNENDIEEARKMAYENNIIFYPILSTRWEKNDPLRPSEGLSLKSKNEHREEQNANIS